MTKRIVSVNGEIKPAAEAVVSFYDRGNNFGDGVYEYIRVYDGKPFLLDKHFRRLEQSLKLMRIDGVDLIDVGFHLGSMMEKIDFKDAAIYIQISRGPYPRSHSFSQAGEMVMQGNPFEDSIPDGLMKPTIGIDISEYVDNGSFLRTSGCTTITREDERWKRCYIKSINLGGNMVAMQAAKEAGVYEAILVNDRGLVTEGSHTNVFAVINGELYTAPTTCNILPGITREVVLSLAMLIKVPIMEKQLTADELKNADEVFLTGTTTHVMPVIEINKRPVANGRPGRVTRKLQEAFKKFLVVKLK